MSEAVVKASTQVGEETAEQFFNTWCEEMDVENDENYFDAEDLKAFTKQKRKLTKAIVSGALTFNDEGEAVYTPQNRKSKNHDPITFHERTGASIMAMDGKKAGHDARKMYAIMADMCRVPPNVFAGLVGTDGKLCEAICVLLMD